MLYVVLCPDVYESERLTSAKPNGCIKPGWVAGSVFFSVYKFVKVKIQKSDFYFIFLTFYATKQDHHN